jgi:hypothetical protein
LNVPFDGLPDMISVLSSLDDGVPENDPPVPVRLSVSFNVPPIADRCVYRHSIEPPPA